MSNIIEQQWGHTFSSFGGCDIVVSLSGEVIGEVQSVYWEEDLETEEEFKIKGHLSVIDFGRDPMQEIVNRKEPFDISITCMNEEGRKMHLGVLQAQLTKRCFSNAVDQVVLEEVYQFKAKSHEKTYGEKKTGEG